MLWKKYQNATQRFWCAMAINICTWITVTWWMDSNFCCPTKRRTEWRRERLFGQVANTNAWLIGPWRPIRVWARYGHESHNIVSMLVFYLYICCFSPARPNPISIQFIHVYDANTRCSESLHFSLNFSLHLRTSWHFLCLEFARKSKNKWIIQFIDKNKSSNRFDWWPNQSRMTHAYSLSKRRMWLDVVVVFCVLCRFHSSLVCCKCSTVVFMIRHIPFTNWMWNDYGGWHS